MATCKNKIQSQTLGSGTFGEVYLLRNSETNETTAVKVLKNDNKPVLEFDSLVELDVLFGIKSNALVYGINIYKPMECLSFDSISIEMPYYGTVAKLIKDNLTFEQKIFLIYKLILGVKCLHDNKILHLDIKPDNCLYSGSVDNPDLVVSDFGLSCPVDDVSKGVSTYRIIGTLGYRPPEWMSVIQASNNDLADITDEPNFSKYRKDLNYVYNDKFDVWSIGITALAFLTRTSKNKEYYIPDGTLSYNEIANRYILDFTDTEIELTLDSCLKNTHIQHKNQLYTLLKGLLAYEPYKRMSVDDLLRCEIFKLIDLPTESKVLRNATGKQSPYPKPKPRKLIDYPEKCVSILNSRFNIEPLNTNKRHGLKFILAVYYGMFKKYYIRDLFVSIDLYMRLICATKNLSRKLYKYIAILSIRMTYKYYYNSATTFPSTLQNAVIENMELTAIQFLKGIIKFPIFYDIADCVEQLDIYFALLIKDNFSLFNSYFMIDNLETLEIINQEIPNKQTSKITTCDAFFKKAKISF